MNDGAIAGLEGARAALARGDAAVLWARTISDVETPVSAAIKLIEAERGDWMLESVEGGETRARYSLIGLDPDLMFRVRGERAEINRDWRGNRDAFAPCDTDPLTALRALVSESAFDVPAELPRALATLVGFCGFETVGLAERLPRAARPGIGLPDMLFVRPRVILIFDRLADTLTIVAPIWRGARNPARAIEEAQERIEATLARLARPLDMARRDAIALPATVEPDPVIAPADYAAMVHRAQELIVAGDIFQVVLAQRYTAPFPLAPFDLYRALRRINPSPFLYFFDMPGFALIGSSPEILVRARDGEVTIRPIAGTRPRGATDAADVANRDSLLADPKERAEHLMLLDLGRNDVGRVAVPGTVQVTDSFGIEYYSHVMHIVSNVTGRLDPRHDAIDALLAGFPAGTVSGAPKIRACEIIAELEPEARGAYAGCVGYFGPDGSMDSCIVLRTAVVKDGVMHVQAGAGIVADSTPEYEARECAAKAGALFAAAREAVRIAGAAGFGQ